MNGFVRGADVHSMRVGIAVHGDRTDPQLSARSRDTYGDLTTIRDEDFAKQRRLGQSGMFPCFLGGFLSRLVRSVSSASIRRGRVSRGSMMSSTYPRAAATYGFANFSL